MSLSLIIPMAADKPEYNKEYPHIFNFTPDGTLSCLKTITGLDLHRFSNIYITILKKHDEQFAIKRLLDLQIQRMNLHHAEVVVLENVTSCQPESVYQTIKIKNISNGIFVKDADSYFECDFTEENGIATYPLDKLNTVDPQHKSYVALDDQFYITNIIEKKIISRYFNAGGYVFASANEFCTYYKRLDAYGNIYMSHIVYSMLLDRKNFRPFMVNNYRDFNLI